MIFNGKPSSGEQDDTELQGYISSYSDSDGGCQSILSYSDEMTDSDVFDVSTEFPNTRKPDNMIVEDFNSFEYYNNIGTVNCHQQSTHQCMYDYQSESPSDQYNNKTNYSQMIPLNKNSSTSSYSESLNSDRNAYVKYVQEHNSPKQASPDSQNSYISFNSKGKGILNRNLINQYQTSNAFHKEDQFIVTEPLFYHNEHLEKRLKKSEKTERISSLVDMPDVSSTTSPTKSESDLMYIPSEHSFDVEPWRDGKIHEYEIDPFGTTQSLNSNSEIKQKNSKKSLQVNKAFSIAQIII